MYVIEEHEWRRATEPSGGAARQAPAPGVELHHSVTDAVDSPQELISVARAIYDDHVNTRGWADVFYGFLVGRDGGVLVARGWDRTAGAITSIVVCLVGNYDTDTVTDVQAATVAELRRLAHDEHQAGLELRWHRQRDATACPGAHVIADIAAGRFTIPQPTPPPPAPPVPTPEPIDMDKIIIFLDDSDRWWWLHLGAGTAGGQMAPLSAASAANWVTAGAHRVQIVDTAHANALAAKYA